MSNEKDKKDKIGKDIKNKITNLNSIFIGYILF